MILMSCCVRSRFKSILHSLITNSLVGYSAKEIYKIKLTSDVRPIRNILKGPYACTTATARTTPSKKCVLILLWNFSFVEIYSVRLSVLKPWSNGPASSRKWTQVELAYKLALGGQTDTQVSSQVHTSRK